jgi:hypothetical protein
MHDAILMFDSKERHYYYCSTEDIATVFTGTGRARRYG